MGKRKATQDVMEELLQEFKVMKREMKALKEKFEESEPEHEHNSIADGNSQAQGSPPLSARTPHSSPAHSVFGNQDNPSLSPQSEQEEEAQTGNKENKEDQKELQGTIEPSDKPLEEEIVDILGEDPTLPKAVNEKWHSSIHNRWTHWLQKGLQKDVKDSLLEKYVPPKEFKAPKLNPEIELKLAKHSKARDIYMCLRQQMAGAALTALGSVITSLIVEPEEGIDKMVTLERLFDCGKLLVEIMHSQTKSRSAFILAGVDKDTKAILETTKPDEYLFGANLAEKYKDAKALDKVASEIKKPQQPKGHRALMPSQSLNYNGLVSGRPFTVQPGQQLPYQGQSMRGKQRVNFRSRQQGQHPNRKPRFQGYVNQKPPNEAK